MKIEKSFARFIKKETGADIYKLQKQFYSGKKSIIDEVYYSKVVESVCSRYDITKEQLTSLSQKHSLTVPRSIAYLLLHKRGWTYKEIMVRFNKKDHTTVLNSLRNIDELLETNKITIQKYKTIQQELINQ